jgi:hypothetical protein
VPGSINSKPGRDAFVSVIREWHPERIFTLAGLVDGFGVKLGPKGQRHAEVNAGTKGMTDRVFDWLNAQGMVKHAKTDGWWEIVCPFAEEHIADPRDDAAYKPIGADNRGTRAFKCFHSHGEDGGFTTRCLDWVAEQGGPRTDNGAADRMTAAVKKMAALLPAKVGDPYTTLTLAAALGNVPKTALARQDTTDKGHAKLQPTTVDNVEAVLAHLGVTLRYNTMTHDIEYTLPASVDAARLNRRNQGENLAVLLNAIEGICNTAGMRDVGAYRRAATSIAMDNIFHPMDEWVRSVPWDGHNHFGMLLQSIETPTPQLLKAYLWRWLVQCVEAACGYLRNPPSQKSGVLVLVGPQGIGKTTWLTSLAPEFSMEGAQLHLSGFNARDSMHVALSKTVVELGELEITFSKSETGALKNFLSMTHDKYRLPYAANYIERPRTTSFCGSVNDPGFLVDTSGSRRFWPVEVTRCFGHGVDEQQLWAQVYAKWVTGEKWWLTPEEDKLRADRADRYMQVDAITQTIQTDADHRLELAERGGTIECGVNITEVHRILNLPTDRRSLSTGTAAMNKYVGKMRDLRLRGGASRAWIFHATGEEKTAFKLRVLKPDPDKKGDSPQ